MCVKLYWPGFEPVEYGLPDWWDSHQKAWASYSYGPPEVSVLAEEVDYERIHRASRLMSGLSAESVSAGFIPSVVMCAACGEKPAEDREMSVFALCAGCCEKIRQSYMADTYREPGSPEMSESDRMTAVWKEMYARFAYEMMDTELAKMFD